MDRCYRLVLLALMSVYFSSVSVAEEERSPIYENESGHQRYSAIIKDVIDVDYHGFRSLKYLVIWKDQEIIIPDPNLHVQKKKGDELKFLVMWHTLYTEEGEIKNLNFSALE